MVEGIFVKNIPFVRVSVGIGDMVRYPNVVLDTGFTGYLQIRKETAFELGLVPLGVSRITVADGRKVNIQMACATVSIENEKNYVQVLISDGLPLVGIGFLSQFGYKAIIDCKYKTIKLEKSA